jgi:SAM-dependent methyltransferase
MTAEALRQRVMGQAQGALALNVAYVGVVNGLFGALASLHQASAARLATAASCDPGYVTRWCDAAFAFELLDEVAPGVFALTALGEAFRPETPGTLMSFAVQSVLSAHMAERAAGLARTGERPGERVLEERETLLPWFGPMLEHHYGPILDQLVLPGVPAYGEVDRRGGLAVDLGCGNGWYLRRLARRHAHLRGIGLDGFADNIRQATQTAAAEGLAGRLAFQVGDLHHFTIGEPVDLIAMNRALHHVWDQKENVFRILRRHLKPGGVAIIWEPHWPAERRALREPGRRAMAFQNLAEHVQGNHFLRPDEIEAEFRRVGMESTTYLFADGREAVVVGVKGSAEGE